jgi:hypothetical protein
MDTYISRVCWNSAGWQHPTGDAQHLESSPAYVVEHGFGHEEWLFDYSRTIDGYHYGFLQPVSDSQSRLEGNTIHVLLFAINAEKERMYVGDIENCEVLTKAQSDHAQQHYQDAGWLQDMRESVQSVGGDSSRIDSRLPSSYLFDVRFKIGDGHRYPFPRKAADGDSIAKLNRYKLFHANTGDVATWRRGHERSPNSELKVITRSGTPATTYDPTHKRMQKELFDILGKQFGRKYVKYEENNVDLMVQTPERTILIEVKTDATAREAIRAALGQILEYAYFNSAHRLKEPELVIIAPAPMTTDVHAYLALLRERFALNIRYLQFTLGGTLEML